MGAKGKVAAVVLENFADAVGGYFGGVLTPASIVSGTCLGELYVLPTFAADPGRTSTEKFLIKLYRLLTWTAFTLALSAVITCTIASVRILGGEFDPMAGTAFELLRREFEYEFVCTYWSFAVSLLCFVIIVTLRFVLEFNLLRSEDRTDTAKFVGFSSVALVAHLVSDLNEALFSYSNLWKMTLSLVRIVVGRVVEEPTAMRIVALLATAGAFYFGCKSVVFSSCGGKPSSSEEEVVVEEVMVVVDKNKTE